MISPMLLKLRRHPKIIAHGYPANEPLPSR